MTLKRIPQTVPGKWVLAVALAWALVGVAFSFLPQAQYMEQRASLPLLFHLRGDRTAPSEVAIVRIDQRAASSIHLSRDPDRYFRCQSITVNQSIPGHEPLPSPTRLTEWPRCIHGELIKSLTGAGARLIAFDVLFRPRPALPGGSMNIRSEEDRLLVKQIETAGNVLLSRRLDPSGTPHAGAAVATADNLSPLSIDFERAALGSGIFLLPDAESGRFDRFVAFAPNTWLMSSFPGLAVQAYLREGYEPFRELLVATSPPARELLSGQYADMQSPGALEALTLLARQLFVSDASLHDRMRRALESPQNSKLGPAATAEVAALARMYSSPMEHYFNFYGPPGTIRNVGYEEVLDVRRQAYIQSIVKDKVVFVGRAELNNPETDDYFHTVYSGKGGVDTSGVELAATAFANLLHGESIAPLPSIANAAIALLFGLAVVLLLVQLPIAVGVVIVVAITLAYLIVAVFVFSRFNVWLPIAVPVGIQTGVGIIGTSAWVYWRTKRYAGEMRTLFGHFVPPHVVDGLIKHGKSLGDQRESLTAACVATDVERYVAVAEGLSPAALSEYLDRYFAVLFDVVSRNGGLVTDVVGDAMMAVWPDRNGERAIRAAVCNACLELIAAVDTFNQRSELQRLPTRIGVDWGSIALGPVGAGAHYEFRAIGDPVNTSSRIQGLNKQLGTWLLVSQAMVDGLDELLIRKVGTFLLRGKSIPMTLYELIGRKQAASAAQLDLCSRFAQGLQCARDGHFQRALVYFRGIARDFPGDGPSAFYISFLERPLVPDMNIIPVD